ncbi:Uncharacterised protein [Streptococcus pneumoniae]|nr:Uncharacterised protein [Streptococcus pneumoniae]
MVGRSVSSRSRSRYSLPSGEVKSIWSRIASNRLTCPSSIRSQDGVEESSKSASQPEAPELRALIVIFRSTGPVISTRRSCRPGASGATRQESSSRTRRVDRR